MQLKDDSSEEPRARFHMHRKLAKAVKSAEQLKNLCAKTADPRTVLEAEVLYLLLDQRLTPSGLLLVDEWKFSF